VPVAFVCEDSEALVELDIDYGRLAQESGVPVYLRVPTVGTAPEFIAGLAGLARRAAGSGSGASMVCGCDAGGGGPCAAGFGGCPLAAAVGS
jgi:ferrochelatase